MSIPASKVKISPYYTLMEILFKEKSNLLTGYTIEQRENQFGRKTFYIKMDNRQKEVRNLFPSSQYHCVDRHLSLDREYESSMGPEAAFNFSIAHCTERYESRSEKEADAYVVHLFINHICHVLGFQVMQCKAEISKEVKVSAEQQILIRRGAIQNATVKDGFIDFLRKLSAEHDRRLNELEVEALKIDEIAAKLGQSFPKTLDAHHKQVERFSEVITQINELQLTNKIDVRDLRMQDIHQRARDFYSQKPPKLRVEREISDAALAEDEPPMSHEDPKASKTNELDVKLRKERTKLIAEIKVLSEAIAIDPLDTLDRSIERHDKIESLNKRILQFYCFPSIKQEVDSRESKAAASLISTAENNITVLREKINKLFEESMSNLDLESIKKLFPLVTENKQSEAQNTFLTKRYNAFFDMAPTVLDATPIDLTKKEAFVSVGNFLLKNSKQYSNVIWALSCVNIEGFNDVPYLISKLASYVVRQQNNTFLFFVEQGIDVNSMAIACSTHTASLLAFCTYFHESTLALALLRKGARMIVSTKIDVEASSRLISHLKPQPRGEKYTYEAMRARSDNKSYEAMMGVPFALAKVLKNSFLLPSQPEPMPLNKYDKLLEVVKFPSSLYLACTTVTAPPTPNLFDPSDPQDLIHTLLTSCSLAELTFCVTTCANERYLNQRSRVPHTLTLGLSRSGIYCCDTFEQANSFDLEGDSISDKTSVGFIFYPPNPEKNTPHQNQVFALLKVLISAFQKKLDDCSIQEIHLACIKLSSWLNKPSLLIKNEPLMKKNLFLSTIFLIVAASDNFLKTSQKENVLSLYLENIKWIERQWNSNFIEVAIPDLRKCLQICRHRTEVAIRTVKERIPLSSAIPAASASSQLVERATSLLSELSLSPSLSPSPSSSLSSPQSSSSSSPSSSSVRPEPINEAPALPASPPLRVSAQTPSALSPDQSQSFNSKKSQNKRKKKKKKPKRSGVSF